MSSIEGIETRTSRPRASRFRIREQVLLQSLAKSLISASWGAREGGRDCCALPSMKSPKFIALVGWLACLGYAILRYDCSTLFEITSL